MNLTITFTELGELMITPDTGDLATRAKMLHVVCQWAEGNYPDRGYAAHHGDHLTISRHPCEVDVPVDRAWSEAMGLLLVRHLVDVSPSFTIRLVRAAP